MTVFEKIYWTLWFVGEFLEREFFAFDYITEFFKGIIKFNLIFIIGYWIVKLVLWIWGIHICLFPSLEWVLTS